MTALSVAKFEEGIINEDAVKASRHFIAVSDGAGGGGVFADQWSRYLVENIPEQPFLDYSSFDRWLDEIWEPFYNRCEEIAKHEGGMLLNKFYDEGSFATLAIVWNDGSWMSYGDSVAFCYDTSTGLLEHSFSRLVDFNDPPYLINCKDPTDIGAYKCGKFPINSGKVVFVTSDTLAHYILMMYEASHSDLYTQELEEAIHAQTKDSNFIRAAMNMKRIDFEKDVIRKMLNCRNTLNLSRHLKSLKDKGLIGHDDYSIAIM